MVAALAADMVAALAAEMAAAWVAGQQTFVDHFGT